MSYGIRRIEIKMGVKRFSGKTPQGKARLESYITTEEFKINVKLYCSGVPNQAAPEVSWSIFYSHIAATIDNLRVFGGEIVPQVSLPPVIHNGMWPGLDQLKLQLEDFGCAVEYRVE